MIKKLGQGVLFLLAFIALFLAYHFYSNAPVTSNEIFRDDEAEQIQRSVNNFINVIERNKTSYVARGAHSKGHACVKAYFDVMEDMPPDLQHGIFNSPGKRYKTWIRFSNGRSSMKNNHDADKDARGMAIKIFNLHEQILNHEKDDIREQDFLMHDAPVFFTANIEDYNRFVESDDKILYFFAGKNPFNWNVRELFHGLATLKEAPSSPLQTQYFSNTAYKLGPHNIKFSAKSCSEANEHIQQDRNDPDFLKKTMMKELQSQDACFNFMVQLQRTDKYMPIEDPSIKWKESDSPFIRIAKITIVKQNFNTDEQHAFCENLSFSPWHALQAHRPIGELNRIRKEVYEASSHYRHKQNETMVPTNLHW